MPKGVYDRHPKPLAVWDDANVRRVSAVELLAVYREQVAALRAAADPAVTDRRRGLLVTRVYKLRMELRRRHLLPESRWSACDE